MLMKEGGICMHLENFFCGSVVIVVRDCMSK